MPTWRWIACGVRGSTRPARHNQSPSRKASNGSGGRTDSSGVAPPSTDCPQARPHVEAQPGTAHVADILRRRIRASTPLGFSAHYQR
jgi:hypothetical protein